MAGNVLVGGLIGAAIDANSGATQNLVPNPLVVHMEAEATPISAPAPAPAAAVVAEPIAAAPADTAPADAAPADAAPAEALVQQPAQ